MLFSKNHVRDSHKVHTISAKPKHCKNSLGVPTKIEMLKYSREVSMIMLVNIECIDYSC